MGWRNSMERPWRRWKRNLFKTRVTIPCFYCNVTLSQKEASVDHIIPKSKGGSNDPSNYLISCRKCNSDRGSLDINIWVDKIINSEYNINMNKTVVGRVSWWNDSKGFGYIVAELDGREEKFFAHYSNIQDSGFKTLSEGQEVEFNVLNTVKGFQAINIIKK